MASTNIYRTQTTGNTKTWTYSAWLKKGSVGNDQVIFKSYTSGSDYIYLRFNSNNDMYMESATGGASKISFTTNRKFRDVNAWMHVCLRVDMTQSVSTDRWKLFINGVDEADVGGYSASSYAAEDDNLEMNTVGAVLYIGSHQSSGEYFDGCMSWCQLVDGTALNATEFGEEDATSGVWKIKTDVYGTPGTNGFCLKMEDRTNLDLDSSSNALTFTTGGTATPTYDNPSNNFCTMSPISGFFGSGMAPGTFTHAMTTGESNRTSGIRPTMRMEGGKWYTEVYIVTQSGDTQVGIWGNCDKSANAGAYSDTDDGGTGYMYDQDGSTYNNNVKTTWGNTFTDGDVIGIAVDLDNLKIYFSINGTWQESGDPTSGATGTGAAYTLTAAGSTPNGNYGFCATDVNTTQKTSWNFGNGYFGTTSTGTTETDEAGIGQFKYDVPEGYYSLCTKNISVQGG